MFLQVEGITKYYKDKKAISDVSFNLEEGKLLCLLGPSGCGKSTILNAIGGFIKLTSGKIILDGNDITNKEPENRNVSTVFQSYGLFAHMNVLSNIIYGLKFKRIPKAQRIAMGREIMTTVGLEGYEKKQIGELSGGEQQRVALARSLIIKPKLLLLDEPLSNLDTKLRIAMRKEIQRVQKTFKITTVFVTHDQAEAFEIADKIILMNEGRIMQTGTADELYNKPANEFVLNFIGAANKLDSHYVRPEKISVAKAPDAEHTEAAYITNIVFRGETIELVVKTHEATLSASVLNNNESYRIGERVFLRYSPEQM